MLKQIEPEVELSTTKKVSLIIPAYNEKDRIQKTLMMYSDVLEGMNKDYEIIVVIDGNDGTEDIVKQFRNAISYKSKKRLGKGGAILKGMNMSEGDIVGFVDADGSLSSEDLRKIILSVDDRSFVIASRYGKDSVWLKKEPLFNRMASRAFNFLVNSVLHLNVKDTQCGAKFMSKSVAKEILRQIKVSNRTFDVSMIYHAKKSKAKILETPVTWKHDENSRLPIGHAILPMFLTILGIRFMNSRYSHRVPSWVFKVLSKFRFY